MRFAFYGAGEIASIHAQAIAHVNGEVITFLDPGRSEPLAAADGIVQQVVDLDGMRALRPDAVVVATPTGGHAAAVRHIASAMPGVRLLVEKPVATTAVGYRSAMAAADAGGCPVTVLLHAAHAPEVAWAAANLSEWVQRHGGVERATSRFCDPYARAELSGRRRSLVSSWVDSGINMLSVLDRLFVVESIAAILSDPPFEHVASAVGRYGPDRFPVVLATSWRVFEPSKSTMLEFQDGAQLILDHQAVCGWLFDPNGQPSRFWLDGTGPRLRVHYERMFEQEAVVGWRPHRELDDRLHGLLFAGLSERS